MDSDSYSLVEKQTRHECRTRKIDKASLGSTAIAAASKAHKEHAKRQTSGGHITGSRQRATLVLAAAEEIGDGAPQESEDEDERGEKEHNNIAEDMKGVAPDIETPMPNCRIANPIRIGSGLTAQCEKEKAIRTAFVAFELSTIAAVPQPSLLIGSIPGQRTLRHVHWNRIGHIITGVVVVGSDGKAWRSARSHGHRSSTALLASVVVVDVVGDINYDVARRVVHCLTARARHRLSPLGHAKMGTALFAIHRHNSERYWCRCVALVGTILAVSGRGSPV
jgi:hypothetical protein